MDQDFFKVLPSEITLDILSRLPAKTTMICKCVCKPWLNLIMTPEFVKSHLSKSVPGLAILESSRHSKPFKIAEFVDELDLNYDYHRLNIVFNLELPFHEPLHSSVNGLILLGWEQGEPRANLLLCNPITRDYITLPCPQEPPFECVIVETYGFGVSQMSGQYKVVRFFLESSKLSLDVDDRFECQVYTVGTGLWRRIAFDSGALKRPGAMIGAFLKGNLHWLTHKGSSRRISCLDLETELFSIFPAPLPSDDCFIYTNLSVLGDCLCLCENLIHGNEFKYEIHIWLMKEYGDGNSWTKQFTFRIDDIDDCLWNIWPIKVFEDGDILMIGERGILLYYSSVIVTTLEIDRSKSDDYSCSTTIYAPSFVPLKTFATENVISF